MLVDAEGKLDITGNLEEWHRHVDNVMKQATREVLLIHKAAGNPIAVWRDGRVSMIQPEDIVIE